MPSPGRCVLLSVSLALVVVAQGLCSGPAVHPELTGPLELTGDLRARYEANSEWDGSPERHRGVLRLRLGASLEINDQVSIGARMVTGDSGNPRTADVTLGDLDDDLELSLDRAFVEMHLDRLDASVGKVENPFTTTELVWDNDVNPTGAVGQVDLGAVGGLSAHLTGMYMIVDEQEAGSDSSMWGGQVQLEHSSSSGMRLTLAAAYWDYRITSLVNADDPGDVRGNYTREDGSAYLSDFDLADIRLALELPGLGSSYPVRIVLDWVKNLGAVVDEDEGVGLDVSIGRPWVERQIVLRYWFSQCETDAVLGSFSHDNLPVATSYRSHSLGASYGLLKDTMLSLTWYYFSHLEQGSGRAELRPGEHGSRVRLDLMTRL